MLQPGDRVRWETVDESGFPVVRYGFVGGSNGDGTKVAVMFDGELKDDAVVDLDQLEPVTITNVELRLTGADLLDDPSLRQGLVNLWTAEADQAGLEIRSIDCLGTEARESGACIALAEVWAAGRPWVLKARPDASAPDVITVRADPI
jgi:hypothetical protein